jgi:hypothetical protein
MTVRYSAPGVLPHVCAVYVCRGCGRSVTRHGREVDTLPAGWVVVPGEAEPDHVCASCAERAPRPPS